MKKVIILQKEIIDKLNKYLNIEIVNKAILETKHESNLNNFNEPGLIVNLERINNVRRINKFHERINVTLVENGMYLSCAETLNERSRRYQKKAPYGLKIIIRFIDFIWKRLIPKVPILKKIYFALTNGHNRVLSKSEILGRIISCGFEVEEYFEYNNLLYVIAKKIKNPAYNMKPSYGALFTMSRIGYQGKMINVYKFRTMYPYSEYCQALISEENNLAISGKINNDYRITLWGKYFRKYWIDELPMIINLFKGELNIVGVRPLSKHYYSLYPKDVQELRIKVKPGLVPPFYADLPKSFEEIVESERKYILMKLKNPIMTDLKYLYKAFVNIVFKGARSK
jgi:lipopolysaccharide/colanic/teichoic acid biosynthesis glycosyltransferase